ncbi:MAG: hypothetical protein Ct9H300mP1_37750 [Planctomycetaceae bacterium]|nr:MAG: hypothetical protein Ct9H300mP1_37750 [Planctomycetaceae bacterium]
MPACTVAWSTRILPPGGATDPMCGFAGASWTDPQHAIDATTLDAMTAVLTHGPDQSGTWFDANTALGHRRLRSSTSTPAASHWPTKTDRGRWSSTARSTTTANFATMQGRGHRFATQSDTEVIVHLYEEYGDDCVDHLRGMFALAVRDVRRQRLLLARTAWARNRWSIARIPADCCLPAS